MQHFSPRRLPLKKRSDKDKTFACVPFGVWILVLLLLPLPLLARPGHGLTALPARPLAPDFTLTDVDGHTHHLADYRGKVVIINFWATWCPPCRAEMPSMQRAWEKISKEGILMLAINVGQDEEAIFQFTADYPVEFPLLLDQDSQVTGKWPVKGLPTTFILDPLGRIAYRAVGGRNWDDDNLLAPIRALGVHPPKTAPKATTPSQHTASPVNSSQQTVREESLNQASAVRTPQ